jgi:acyl-CoA synthetase (AMP-forming)/AMP-acid ligase II
VTCAGGALSKASIGALQECLPKTEIYVMYGQTEASARLSYLEPSDVTRKMGSIGKGIPGVRLRVLRKDGTEVLPGEVGEITAEGDCLMKGYWNNPGATQKTLKANRLYTGDLATIDEEGFIFVVGRASEIIKSGSYRIHPIEIEEVLNSHPGVLESAAVGVDDTVLGEAIVAFIVARPDGSPPPSDLLRHARKFLPAFKVPRKIVFVDRLPKTSSGKIKRAALR